GALSPGEPPLLEGGDVDHGRGCELHERNRREGSTPLAESETEVDERRLAEFVEEEPVPGFTRAVRGQTVVQGAGLGDLERRGGRSHDVTVEEQRDGTGASFKNRASNGGELSAADVTEDLEGIGNVGDA